MKLCSYHLQCGGCQLWAAPYEAQIAKKTSRISDLLSLKNIPFHGPIEFTSVGKFGLRQRADFTLEFDKSKLEAHAGFYSQNHELLDIKTCLQFSEPLQTIYEEFRSLANKNLNRADSTPFSKGSVRLRIGVNGQKGCWLDFANKDIKFFLEDRGFFSSLLKNDFFVEIGQKGKKLIEENGQLKLGAPKPAPWFKTWLHDKSEVSLKCLISDFTQASWAASQEMVLTTLDYAQDCHTDSHTKLQIIEFGAGIGQFTLPLLSAGHQVSVFEISPSACQHLELNSKKYQLQESLRIHCGDYQRTVTKPVSSELSKKIDLALVNPSRSGLKKFCQTIIETQCPYVIYVSCFPETLTDDLQSLSAHYELCNIKIIDQFPQTEHFECAALLKKLN